MENDHNLVSTPARADKKARSAQALAAIYTQLDEEGSKNWKKIRLKFPEISDRTWWRLVSVAKKTKRDGPDQSFKLVRVGASIASDIEARCEFSKMQVLAVNLASEMAQQIRDIDLLQSYAMKDGKITNFAIFNRALSLRKDTLVAFAKIIGPVAGQLAQEDLVNKVVDIVAEADKDIVLRVMESLRDAQRVAVRAPH